MPTWQYQIVARPVSTTTELIYRGGWYPVYPDQSYGKKLPNAFTAPFFFFVSASTTIPDVYKGDWYPVYPDKAPVRLRGVQDTSVTPVIAPAAALPNIDAWAPIYPVRSTARAAYPTGSFAFSGVTSTELVYSGAWYPSFQDRITPYPVRNHLMQSFAIDPNYPGAPVVVTQVPLRTLMGVGL